MAQLHKQVEAGYVPWSTGAADFYSALEYDGRLLLIAVNCRLGSLETTDIALLDTASTYSVIGRDTAEVIDSELGPAERDITMITARSGRIKGSLRRLKISLLARDGFGVDLDVEGPVLVSPDWTGPTVLGFYGFLEKVRIALDPGVTEGAQTLYFGPVE